MCRTMNELEKVIADYRSLKAMKEQLSSYCHGGTCMECYLQEISFSSSVKGKRQKDKVPCESL